MLNALIPTGKDASILLLFSFAGIVGFAADIGPFYAFPSSAGYFPVIGVAAGPAVILTVPGYGYSRSALESE